MSAPIRRARLALAALLCTVPLLAGCGSDDGGADNGADAGATDPVVVDITVKDGEVTPSGDRVDVKAGQPVDLVVDADADGEIHVHSDPEQQFAYKAGEQTFKIAIERPGVITVEDHELDKVIVQLEVR